MRTVKRDLTTAEEASKLCPSSTQVFWRMPYYIMDAATIYSHVRDTLQSENNNKTTFTDDELCALFEPSDDSMLSVRVSVNKALNLLLHMKLLTLSLRGEVVLFTEVDYDAQKVRRTGKKFASYLLKQKTVHASELTLRNCIEYFFFDLFMKNSDKEVMHALCLFSTCPRVGELLVKYGLAQLFESRAGEQEYLLLCDKIKRSKSERITQ